MGCVRIISSGPQPNLLIGSATLLVNIRRSSYSLWGLLTIVWPPRRRLSRSFPRLPPRPGPRDLAAGDPAAEGVARHPTSQVGDPRQPRASRNLYQRTSPMLQGRSTHVDPASAGGTLGAHHQRHHLNGPAGRPCLGRPLGFGRRPSTPRSGLAAPS